jgi:hypothetical protein
MAICARLHDEFSAPCPSFAMVCLEFVRVTGCFNRDRDREPAYPPPPEKPGPIGKAQRFKAFTTLSARPVLGRSWQTCAEAGSL